ncbi:hypothetical protein MES4922_620005 [Mesorhizobium ventifaucium]|uniref:Transposase n=1 Tax=Mesorhizobium ventifaucium TaxID=666020 RepID=A0ABM9EDD4_9HYPH|nr:hypothetical protein MES4922_620005 [Mesorhizobium ventifaucium]
MTKREFRLSRGELKALLLSDEDGFRRVLQAVVQEALEAEMTETIGAEKGERTAERVGYRSGYYERKLVTRVGSWNFAFRRIGPAGSRRNCSSVINARRRHGIGAGRDVRARRVDAEGHRRSPRNCAAIPSRPRR